MSDNAEHSPTRDETNNKSLEEDSDIVPTGVPETIGNDTANNVSSTDEDSGVDAATNDACFSINPSTLPTTNKMGTTSDKIEIMHSTVVIEDVGAADSPVITASTSRSEGIEQRPATADVGDPSSCSYNSKNNNMAVTPLPQISSKTNQMIPIALLRKSSNSTIADEYSGGAGTGIMHIITGNNKVAPAEAACSMEPSTTAPATTVGAVLMLIPKKSDSVCVEIPSGDLENNLPLENQLLRQYNLDSKTAGAPQQHDDTIVKPTQSYDSYEEVCRICHDNPSKMELISPCLCKGSMSKVHRACLERWLAESAKNTCEICNYEYNTVRKPKYKGCRSIYQWIRNPLSPSDMRNLFFDIACFFILTPLAVISSWLCVVGAQHYTFGEERRRRAKYQNEATSLWDVHERNARNDASNATWTSVGLLSLTGTLLVAYSVWLFVAIKYHIQAWREWQLRNYTVTIVPFEDGCMGRPPPPRPPRDPPNNNNNGSLLGASDNSHNSYNFEVNPNILRYSGHGSVMRGRGGRNLFRQNRQNRRNYNLPPIFSRNHFLRNPPPGYTISETTLLYQALYGSDSDALLNENFLAFFADSSDDITESTSSALTEIQIPSNCTVTEPPTALAPVQEQRQKTSSEHPEVGIFVKKEESTGFTTAIDTEFPTSSINANHILNKNPVVDFSQMDNEQENVVVNCSISGKENNHVVLPIFDADEDEKNNDNKQL